jgi:hypothetical protein
MNLSALIRSGRLHHVNRLVVGLASLSIGTSIRKSKVQGRTVLIGSSVISDQMERLKLQPGEKRK